LDGIVRRVEIRDQDPREILEHFLDGISTPGRSMEISDLLKAGENPDIAFFAHDAGAGLVDMQQAAGAEPFQEMVVSAFVGLRRRSLESVCRVPRYVQTEQFSHAESNATLGK